MGLEIVSVRPFIGCKNFDISRAFYRELGFEEKLIFTQMCVFQHNQFSFYLQDAYVEDWVNNTMLFIEVKNVDECFKWLTSLGLSEKYPGVRVMPIKKDFWGEECFVIDPAGVLLHFGAFYPAT